MSGPAAARPSTRANVRARLRSRHGPLARCMHRVTAIRRAVSIESECRKHAVDWLYNRALQPAARPCNYLFPWAMHTGPVETVEAQVLHLSHLSSLAAKWRRIRLTRMSCTDIFAPIAVLEQGNNHGRPRTNSRHTDSGRVAVQADAAEGRVGCACSTGVEPSRGEFRRECQRREGSDRSPGSASPPFAGPTPPRPVVPGAHRFHRARRAPR